jgi:hypothetical protein
MKRLLSKRALATALSLCAAFAVALSMTGCATVISGASQKVSINSNPPGADVVINGLSKGQTPVDLTIKKELKGQPIELRLDGYETKTFEPTTAFNSTSILNIFIPIGFLVDYMTGAMKKYDPTAYDLKLDKKK